MQLYRLGTSDLEVSALSLGTWAMGGTTETWGYVDDRESIAAIHQALDCGINLIDTAPIYGLGHSEQIVGKAIQGRRAEVVLATKGGLDFPSTAGQAPHRCLSAEHLIRDCEASLRRLRTDVIDLYQCHWPDPETPIAETMEALRTLREQGKIRAIGLSNYNCEELAAATVVGPVHAVQTSFSMLNRRSAEDLLPFCKEHRIGVLTYGTLVKGLLTGKFNNESRFEDLRASDPEFQGDRFLRNLGIVEALKSIADRYNKTLAQLVINWTAGFPGLTAPIIGAKRPSQVIENAGGTGWPILEEDRALIDRVLEGSLR